MNCKRAKLHIALLIGDDLEEDSQVELREHLRECAPCRDYHAGMVDAPQLLHHVEGPELSPHDSLWPDLLDKLPRRPGLRVHDFNGWWAAVAVAVAFVAIGLFWNDEARSSRWGSSMPIATVPVKDEPLPEFRKDVPQIQPNVAAFSQPRPPQRIFPFGGQRILLIPGEFPRRILVSPLEGGSQADYDALQRSAVPLEDLPQR